MYGTRLPSFSDFSVEILNRDLRPCLKAIQDGNGDDEKVLSVWQSIYPKLTRSRLKNIAITLKHTGLSTGKSPLELSTVGLQVVAAGSETEASKVFCGHLLKEKNATKLIDALVAMNARQVRVTKATLKTELERLGVTDLANGTTDHLTLKNWLIHAGLVSTTNEPNDSELKAMLGISSKESDEFRNLTLAQQAFLNLLRKEHLTQSGPFQGSHLIDRFKDRHPNLCPDDRFAETIRTPLVNGGWIVVVDLAGGRQGGKSGKISGTSKLLDIPASALIPDFDQVIPAALRSKVNTPLDVISKDLFGRDKYKAGFALELLALRMILDLDLEPRHFRLRSAETAYAEVDLIAEGSHLLFSRWTFQCKRYGRDTTTKLTLSDVAKEVGIAIFSKAHVIVMVTTTSFTKDAYDYALEVSRATHLQFVFVDGKAIDAYLKHGRNSLWQHFESNAKGVMAIKHDQRLPEGE